MAIRHSQAFSGKVLEETVSAIRYLGPYLSPGGALAEEGKRRKQAIAAGWGAMGNFWNTG